MNQERREKIIKHLTAYLNRAPSENEIMNAQSATRIMSKVEAEEAEEVRVKQDQKIDANKAEVEAKLSEAGIKNK